MKTQRFDNVWDAIETIEDAENLKQRSVLLRDIKTYVSKNLTSNEEAAAMFGISQNRIADMENGKISSFSIEDLQRMVKIAGIS